jgi:hypothetical protein
MEAFQELHAVYTGEPDVQQHERGLQGIEPLPEAFGVRKGEDFISLVLQNALDGGGDGRYVVYDTDRVHIRLYLLFVGI